MIGMSGLFPGSENLDQFWQNLIDNRDLTSMSEMVDFGADPKVYYHEEKGKLDQCYSLRGGYVHDFNFDPDGYRLSSDFLRQQDPQFQWSLYVAKRALEDAKYWAQEKALKRCGVILGNLSFPTRYSRQVFAETYASLAEDMLSNLTGENIPIPAANTNYPASLENTIISNAPAALVAQAVGLKGMHFSLDAACASSLYAVKLACDELHNGKADMMLAGAVSGADPLFIHMGFSYFHAYARHGEKSTPMDSESGGLTSAEGAGMVVLKRLADAQRDGDQILALIDGVGLSNDGKGKFLLSPNPKGQKLAFERAYEQCELQPSDIDYLECHATGTPLGDKTEINSIADFFVDPTAKVPLLGSAKSNMGHLLTAAGMAGMIKVILAMQKRFIPASIHIESPVQSESGAIGGPQMVRENQAWPLKGTLPHAGINAFGFGGTNAHLILSAYEEQHQAEPTNPKAPKQSMAITGMELHFGACETLEEFYLALVKGEDFFRSLPQKRWKGMEQLLMDSEKWPLPNSEEFRGAWLESYDLDLLRFKIQPKEAERLTYQQTLLLKVAYEALLDAGMEKLSGQGANVAVITAMESELEIHHRMGRWDLSWQVNKALSDAGFSLDEAREAQLTRALKNGIFHAHEDHSPSEHTGFIGNIMSSRISALMDFTGPAFTISSNENAVYKGLEIARNLLASQEVDAVVLGAIDLTGSVESLLSRRALNPVNGNGPSLSWERDTEGWAIGEGAGAIVLRRSEEMKEVDRVYAHLDDLVILQSQQTDARGVLTESTIQKAASQVLAAQELKPSDIGLLEVSGSGLAKEDQLEIAALTKVYPKQGDTLTCAVSSSKAYLGHTFSASGMVAIIQSALSLYHRLLPGIPNWKTPQQKEQIEQSAFYFPTAARPWIPEPGQDTLRAAINGIASDGTVAHLLLSEADHPQAAKASSYVLNGGERIFPLKAASLELAMAALEEWKTAMPQQGLTQWSDQCCQVYQSNQTEGKTIVLIAADEKTLLREISFYQKLLPNYWNGVKPLATPGGSYFTPQAQGKQGKTALMYPGSGSAYPMMGADLFQAFPTLYDYVESKVSDPNQAFFPNDLYPRSQTALDAEVLKQLEKDLQTKALPMMAIGVTFSAAYTELLQNYLGVKADSVMGFSMGATSAMWYSQGIWDASHTGEKFIEAPLFQKRVGGDMNLLGEVWEMPAEEAKAKWQSVLLKIPGGIPGYKSLQHWYQEKIAPQEDRIWLTFIHTDWEAIFSGDGEALHKCLNRAQLSGMDLTINNVVHHDFCRRVESELLEMHNLPLERTAEKVYYSGVTGKPLEMTAESLSRHATEVCCQVVDWPHLIRRMSEDGHRVFIELGARAFCSRWNDEILAGQAQVSLAIDRKGNTALKNLCHLMARLLAHEVPVDLQYFYQKSEDLPTPKRALKKQLQLGGPIYQEAVKANLGETSFTLQKIKKPEPALALAGVGGGDGFTTEPPKNFEVSTNILPIEKTPRKNNMIIEEKKSLQLGENGLAIQDYNDPEYLKDKTVIWDEQDLLTFATGKISDVFGEEYSIIDTYKLRVMLPMPPYLLVSRVTKLNAKTHEFKPSTITTEYDIPVGSAFTTDQQIPWAVAVESGQCDLLLISYLGIDFQAKGNLRYRLLDCTLTFLDDLPYEGQTLRYDISINSFVRNGDNLLFFFSYRCYVEDRMVLKMDDGCAGFFSPEELAQGQGVVYKDDYLKERASRKQQYFPALLNCDKTAFSQADLLALTEGNLTECFGLTYDPAGRNPSLRLPPKAILMLDRITKVDPRGGSCGLGYIEAVKDLLAEDWYFPCHFRDDEVLAGSLQAEGGGQLLRFFMLYLGMQRLTKDARFQPVLDLPQKVICRKEVPPRTAELIYRMDVREIGLVPEPYVIADLEIIYEGTKAVFFENLGLRLQEKDNPTYLKSTENLQGGVYVKPLNKEVLLNEYHVTQFALGPVHQCFGEEYRVFEGRNLSRQPNTDLQFISRVLEVKGERHTFNDKPEIIAEYDVPADAWYYEQNASPVMPYSVLMEVALQPCGFLGAYLGSTLGDSSKDLFFRNLDGDGKMLREVDLRGKTVHNRAVLTSHTNLAGTVLQRYTFELSVDGEKFYEGNSSFGFFTKADLSSQSGLDQGKHVASWLSEQAEDLPGKVQFNLNSLFGKMKLFRSTNPQSPQLHLAKDQLHLIDQATVVKDGGKYGKGYVHASKFVQPYEWFFTCHFYQDPVMPGSLGVEAIFEAIQLYALQQGLAQDLSKATFRHLDDHQTVWKYRGQILRQDSEMHLEVHIAEVEQEARGLVIRAEASLWKGTLRIYELTQLAVLIG